MTIIGNIFLTFSTLIYIILLSAVYGKEPTRSGDAAAGYPMAVMLFTLAFFVSITIATICVAYKDGFDWVSAASSTRNWLVTLGLVGAVFTFGMTAMFKYEPGGVPVLVRLMSAFVPAFVPLVMIVGGFILVNPGLRAAVPANVYQWPLIAVFGLGALGASLGLYMWISISSENAQRRLDSIQADQDRYHQNYLNEIDTCDVQRNMLHILVFTDANHDQDVRERAIAKVKTNPEWQQELVRLLENKGAIEAFNFLASNDVDDKAMFLEPVNTGILSIADWIRRRIREASHDSHFYPDLFSWEVDRCLRTVARLEGLGYDYRPAVRELRAALDEKTSLNKGRLNCVFTLDEWIKKHP